MTEGIRVDWDRLDRQGWDGLLACAGRTPLEQSWAYGEAVRRACARRGVIRANGETLGLVQVLETRVGPFGLAQILRGPVWLSAAPDPAALAPLKSAYRASRGWLLLWTPELVDGDAAEALMRSARLRRMTTGYSSAWLDLRRDEGELRAQLHVKWRNALRAAERRSLAVSVEERDADHEWLLRRYDADRRARRHAAPPADFVRGMIGAGGEILSLRAGTRTHPVAGVAFARHGAAWTYLVGWTDAEGRRLNAHNLLLWRGMVALRQRGAAWLDVGGVNAAAPGVARFKLGLGGAFYTLSGTYL